MEGAADVASQLRVRRILTPFWIGVIHQGEDFAQFFAEEFADFFIHHGIAMACDKGFFFGRNFQFVQIAQRLVGKISCTTSFAFRAGLRLTTGSAQCCRIFMRGFVRFCRGGQGERIGCSIHFCSSGGHMRCCRWRIGMGGDSCSCVYHRGIASVLCVRRASRRLQYRLVFLFGRIFFLLRLFLLMLSIFCFQGGEIIVKNI